MPIRFLHRALIGLRRNKKFSLLVILFTLVMTSLVERKNKYLDKFLVLPKTELLSLHFTRFRSNHTRWKRKTVKSTIENMVKEQRCKVPNIDPYHPEILPHLGKPILDGCRLKKYGIVKDDILYLKVKNVAFAHLYYIRRPNDFRYSLSDQIELFNKTAPGIRNFGKECWEACGSKGGPCPSFCGEKGVCCRKDFPGCPGNVSDLSPSQHKCLDLVLTTHDIDIRYQIKEEYFKLVLNINGEEHVEYHFAFFKSSADQVEKTAPQDQRNIIIIIFDSVSNAHAQRSLKKTYKYLSEHPRNVIFKGHSIVADGTTGQLCAILTGIPEKDLPEARRGFPNSKSVDNWPFIYKDLLKRNYLTTYSEEHLNSGTFQYRLKGFEEQPTTHYNRAFFLAMDDVIYGNGRSCVHQFHFDYLNQYMDAYKEYNKLGIVFNALIHSLGVSLENADDDILKFYERLSRSEHANNTVVLLMGDHGLRIGKFRSTAHGKLEERQPLLSVLLPPSFDEYREELENFRRNSHLLTSHFDVHSTLHHISTFPHFNDKMEHSKYGKSLFTDLEQYNRSCGDAGVDKHWCTCMNYEAVNVSADKNVVKLAKKIIDVINKNNDKLVKGKCAHLTLQNIIRAGRRIPNAEVIQFTGTKTRGNGCDSCDVQYDDKQTFSIYQYEINFSVSPSGGEYEASGEVRQKKDGGEEIILGKDIGRINLYGNAPNCIAVSYPHLRPYCYCI